MATLVTMIVMATMMTMLSIKPLTLSWKKYGGDPAEEAKQSILSLSEQKGAQCQVDTSGKPTINAWMNYSRTHEGRYRAARAAKNQEKIPKNAAFAIWYWTAWQGKLIRERGAIRERATKRNFLIGTVTKLNMKGPAEAKRPAGLTVQDSLLTTKVHKYIRPNKLHN